MSVVRIVRLDRKEADADPTPAHWPPGRPVSGYGILSLCLAAASFVTAPLLVLLLVAGLVSALLAAAGVLFAWAGLRRSDRRPGLAVVSLRRKVGHPRGIMLYGLKAARIEAELYANELSERSRVHRNTVYRLESEVTRAGPITIRKLCRALGVEPETLRRPSDKSPY